MIGYNNENINKPVTVVREELKNELADAINNSNLPPFIIEPILQDFLREVHVATIKQYERDKAVYEQSLMDYEGNVESIDNERDGFVLETEDV